MNLPCHHLLASKNLTFGSSHSLSLGLRYSCSAHSKIRRYAAQRGFPIPNRRISPLLPISQATTPNLVAFPWYLRRIKAAPAVYDIQPKEIVFPGLSSSRKRISKSNINVRDLRSFKSTQYLNLGVLRSRSSLQV